MDDENIKLLTIGFINYHKVLMNMIAAISTDDSDLCDEEEELLNQIIFQSERPIRINNYITDVVNSYDNIQFQQNFRLKREAFEYILPLIENAIHNSADTVYGRPQVEVKHQLLAVIWLLATPDSYRSVGERFNMSKSLLSQCFVRIINAITSIMDQFIKWPTGIQLTNIKRKFATNTIFKNLIGVVDGTYVPLSVSKENKTAYTNRKCFTSMTLQAICDPDMRYIDVYAGWPSSAPDIRVFKNSGIYRASEENELEYFPDGEYILGDKAYPLLNWCITPFMRRGHMSQAQQNFNKMHASCRQVIERSFALLFGRFRRLRQLDMKRTDWAPATITACCVLHNICLDFDHEMINEYIMEGQTQASNSTGENQASHDGTPTINNAVLKRNAILNEQNTN